MSPSSKTRIFLNDIALQVFMGDMKLILGGFAITCSDERLPELYKRVLEQCPTDMRMTLPNLELSYHSRLNLGGRVVLARLDVCDKVYAERGSVDMAFHSLADTADAKISKVMRQNLRILLLKMKKPYDPFETLDRLTFSHRFSILASRHSREELHEPFQWIEQVGIDLLFDYDGTFGQRLYGKNEALHPRVSPGTFAECYPFLDEEDPSIEHGLVRPLRIWRFPHSEDSSLLLPCENYEGTRRDAEGHLHLDPMKDYDQIISTHFPHRGLPSLEELKAISLDEFVDKHVSNIVRAFAEFVEN